MTDKITQLANIDTPGTVDVPDGGRYLLIWALGRWGGGIIIALFFFYAYLREDDRSAKREDALLEAYRHQSEISVKTSEALKEHTRTIRELTRAAERAHR